MNFFLAALGFWLTTLLALALTVLTYFELRNAVKKLKDVPNWVYKIGYAIKERRVTYEDVTNAAALTEVHLVLLGLAAANLIVILVRYTKGYSVPEAIYFCLRMEFFIVVALRVIHPVFKTELLLGGRIRKSPGVGRYYASANAVLGMVFMTAFFFLITLFLTGVPARPVEVEIAGTRIVIDSTKAAELLAAGFRFYQKNPDAVIVNHRDSHFYYGELAKLIRDGKSYGIVSLTPKWSDSANLSDCVITYYGISGQNKQISAVTINRQKIAALKLTDFKNNKLIDIFAVTPADYRENKGNSYFKPQLQTNGYLLWKRYTIEARFSDDGTAQYEVRAQHTIWE